MQMIDVHSHVFNAAYLPLRGIFISRGVPRGVASPLARLLQDVVERDDALPRLHASALSRSPLVAAKDDASAGWAALLDSGSDPVTTFAREVDTDFLESHAAEIDEAAAEMDRHFPETAAGALGMEAAAPFGIRSEAEAAIGADLARRPAGWLRRKLRWLLMRVAAIIQGGMRFIGWVMLLLSRETRIAQSLADTYPEASLFVHHMMDMDPHYARYHSAGSLYPFVDLQLRRMRALAVSSKGRLLTFVAYSPFREDGVEIVEKWLHRGCAGVKFYAPNGYRPIGNTKSDLDGTGQDAAAVDARNLELFRLCVRLDVPIFAHCQPGEMEAWPRAGCLSDPAGWARVLAMDGLKNLRLCLGHAGGEGWTAPPGEEDAEGANRCGAGARFVNGVVELCVRYPNVFCEFGCLEGIFDPAERARFATRLAAYVQQHGDALSRKLLYGSDWHMLAKAPAPGRYDDAFRTAFASSPVLQPLQERFFFRNTLDYLNLPGYLARSAGHITSAEQIHLQGLLGQP